MTAFTALAAAAVRRLRSAPRKAVRLAVALMAAGLALGSAGAASAADPQPFLWNGSTAPGSLPDALVGQPGYSFSAYVYNNTVSSTSGTVTMVITTPASLSVTGVSVGSGWSCGAASQSITCTHAGAIAGFSNSTDVQVTGNFATNSPSSVSPSVSISGGNDTNSGNNTTTVPISVTVAQPSFSHAFNPTTITVGDSSTITYTLSNFANYIDLTGLAFSNSLPAGLAVASPNGLTSNCSGSASATAGGSSISLTGATLTAQSGTCQIAVNVAASTSGSKVNQPGNLTSNEAPARTPSSRTLTVNAPSLSINDVSVVEGNSGTTAFTFTVSLSAPAGGGGVTFSWATADGTATAGSDYTGVSGGAGSIAAGASSTSLTVQVAGDTTFESNETFFVNLTNVVGATVSDAQGLGTVTNDDVAVPTPTVASVSPATGAAAGGSTVVITGTNLSGATAVTFGGVNAASFVVDGATQITAVTPAGTGTVNTQVTTPGGASSTSGAGDNFTFSTPSLTINDVTLSEGNSGTTTFNFTVSLSVPAGTGGVSFTATAASGTASSGSDFNAYSQSLTIPAGSTSLTVPVSVTGDTTLESSEVFFVNILSLTGAVAADGQGLGTIQNDDLPATPTFSAGPVSAVNSPSATFAFTVTSPATAECRLDSAAFAACTSPVTLTGVPDGTHSFEVRSTYGGTPGGSASRTWRVDTIAPPAPVITSPADGALTTDTTPDITGTAEALSTIIVSIDGGVAGTAFTDGVGGWTFTPSSPLSGAPHTVTATATDQAGNTSASSAPRAFAVGSTDASLSGLTLSQGVLSPAFASGTTSYTASVANAVTSLNVTPTTNEGMATLTVNGVARASGAATAVPLSVGVNTITVVITASDGVSTSTYTVTVTRAPSAVSTLSSLGLSAGTLSPAFSSGTTSYSASVANGVTSVTLTPTASEPNAVIAVNGSGVASGGPSGPLSLLVGANVLTVAVTAQDGVTTSTYTVTVTRAPSAVSTLSNLSLSSGTLSPTFASGTTSYATTVPNAVTAITVTPTLTDANATVTVNGAAVVSGAASASIPLSPGANTITLVATAQDGVSTGTYSVVVTREASSVATLSNLTLSSGTLSPAFSSGTAGYTASVGNAVTSITVTPTVTDATATVTVNGVATTSGSPSAALPLAVGLNTVAVVSTAQDGVTTRTYTVTITRAGSPVSTLSGLAVSGGALSPAFSSGATNYAVSVDGGLAAITVTPTVTQPDATVTVNGVPVTSGAASAPLALNPGANTITVRVTAQDGVSVTTYRITVSRAYSSISTLSGLTLSDAPLTPAFGPATTAYSASVDAATASVTVTPTLTDIAGFITVNGAPAGSGFASDPIPLSVGLNTITVVATAPNGLTSTAYTISVTRGAGAPTAANVSGLNVPHNSTGFDIDLSGSISGARTGVRVVTPPAHGTTTVSGQVVIYTPANGYTGADSFGWVADGPGGTSNTATVSLTVAAPAVPVIPTPPVTPTPPGDGQPVTVTLTDGGGSITDYDVTVQGLNGRATIEAVSSAPSGEAAPGPEGARTFVLRYTPNAGFMGTDTVTLVAVGPGGRSAPAVFTFRVAGKAPDLSAAVALGGSVTLRPTTGLTGGPFQGIRITRAPAFGTAVVQGLTIVYSPGSGPGGSTSFDYVIDLPFGASAAGRVSVTAEATPVIPALTATTIAGRPVTVSLTANALNGPFTAAAVTSVSPAGSGVATLTEGGTPTARTYDLTFTPSGTFTGQAVINFTLSRGAATGSGVLTVTVQQRPDPALDPEVRGIVSSQADTARRFAEAQSGNFLRRLDAVRSGPNRSSFALGLNGGDQQDLLSDPGQALRRQLGFEADPVSRAATESWRMLAPETAAGAAAPRQPAAVPGEASPVGLWASGGVNWGRRDASGRRDDRFTTSGLTAGVDWRVSDTLIVGAGVGYGRDRTRVGSDESRSDGRSRTGALYAGFRPADGVTVGGVLGQGELEFDSRRWSADASAFALGERSGSVTFGAIEAALDRQAGRWGWSPYGRLDMARIRLDAFSETGAGSYALAYEAMDVETMSGALGLRLNGRFARHGQAFEPAIRLEWTHAFDDTETQYLRYADWVASPRYGLELDSWSRDQVTVDLEGRWSVGRQLELTAGYAASLGDSSVSQGLRLRLQAKF